MRIQHMLLALWVCWVSVSVASADSANQPHIILITLDTTRADHLSCYGYFRKTTPQLEALAAESVVFDRCIAPMSVTLPTHATIMTGTFPNEHGVLHNGLKFEATPRLVPFAQACQEVGYETSAFVSATPVKKDTGIGVGFDHFDEPSNHERRAAATNKAVVKWLGGRKGTKPLFLWLHYFDPHWPFDAPLGKEAQYETDGHLLLYMIDRKVPAAARFPTTGPANAIAMTNDYDDEIAYLDRHLGSILETLRRSLGRRPLIIALVGDHGEGLCQHGVTNHSASWDEQLRVPMMIQAPGLAPRRVAKVVSPGDVIPSVISLLDDHPAFEQYLSQCSARNVLGELPPRPLLGQDSGAKLGKPGYRYCITTERWKYYWILQSKTRTAQELYDLQADPFELRNLAAGKAAEIVKTCAELRQTLFEQLQTHEQRARMLRGSTANAPLDPVLIEQLKTLGYVGDDKE